MPPSTFRFVDALLKGTLEKRLRALAADGYSTYRMAAEINPLLPDDCAVDPATYGRYCREVGIEISAPA
jgi:hypothetical protein